MASPTFSPNAAWLRPLWPVCDLERAHMHVLLISLRINFQHLGILYKNHQQRPVTKSNCYNISAKICRNLKSDVSFIYNLLFTLHKCPRACHCVWSDWLMWKVQESRFTAPKLSLSSSPSPDPPSPPSQYSRRLAYRLTLPLQTADCQRHPSYDTAHSAFIFQNCFICLFVFYCFVLFVCFFCFLFCFFFYDSQIENERTCEMYSIPDVCSERRDVSF